jgi:carboxyl-terminal processing protease
MVAGHPGRPLTNTTAVKLTTARYFTPSGRSIQAKGIVPDIIVEETANGDHRDRIREADLERHLDAEKDKAAPKDAEKVPVKPQVKKGKNGGAKDEDEESARTQAFEIASKSDYQLSQAMNLLKAWEIIKKQ